MRRSTDYMFVLDSSPFSLSEALCGALVIAIFCGSLAGAVLGLAGCAATLILTGIVFAVSRPVLSQALQTARELHARSGWDVPGHALRPPSSVLVAAVLALCAACPIVGPIVLLAAILGGAARTRRHAPMGHLDVWRQGWWVLWVYLCYPDRRFQLLDGWFGVWAPEASIGSRQFRAGWIFVPLGAAVGLWLSALLGFRTGPWPVASWVGLLSACVCVLLSPWAVCGALAEAAVRMEAHRHSAFECGPSDWDRCAELVRRSTHEEGGVRLADHVFAGFLQPPHTDIGHPYKTVPAGMLPNARPLLMHKSVTEGHGQVCGKTQTGKTAITMSGLLIQKIRGVPQPVVGPDDRPVVGVDGEPIRTDGPSTPILIIDMKGDLALFNTARDECARRGQPFHAFTLEQGMQSSYFSAIDNFDADRRPTVELTELTANALSLYHGATYGTSYFSAQHRDLLLNGFHSNPRPRTWTELHERLLAMYDRQEHRDVFELLSKVRVLAEYPQLGAPPPGADVIRMKQVLAEGHCVYFWLPASVAAMSVRDVGKLALYAFLTEARTAANAGNAKRAYVFVDEIQCLTGDNLAVVFQQCASTKVSVIMANQSANDLDADTSFRISQVVRDNVSWRCCFSMHDDQEMERWIRASGEECTYIPSYGFSSSTSSSVSSNGFSSSSSSSSSVNWQPVVHRRMNEDLIRQVNYTTGASLVQVDCDGPGGLPLYGIPRRVWTPWPLTKEEYERRSRTPWPRAVGPTGKTEAVATLNSRTHEQVAEEALSEFAALDELFGRLRAERRPARGRRAE